MGSPPNTYKRGNYVTYFVSSNKKSSKLGCSTQRAIKDDPQELNTIYYGNLSLINKEGLKGFRKFGTSSKNNC